MNVDSIRRYCLSFPHAKENLQWVDELCFKIAGKIFVMLGLESVPQRMCFKCTPENFAELVEQEGIRPAPYVGRYKWVMLDRLDALPDDELRELIHKSYAMVAAKAKVKKKIKPKANLKTSNPSKPKPRTGHKPTKRKKRT
jgi:predicted DNA-binding protein (MmcQ/YjbR family)